MSEDNLRKKLRLPWVSFASDAGSLAPEGPFLKSNPHPRAYGNFARWLGRYVRDEKIVPLEEGIRRLSALPAENLGLKERGRLAEGFFADVVVFDPGDDSGSRDVREATSVFDRRGARLRQRHAGARKMASTPARSPDASFAARVLAPMRALVSRRVREPLAARARCARAVRPPRRVAVHAWRDVRRHAAGRAHAACRRVSRRSSRVSGENVADLVGSAGGGRSLSRGHRAHSPARVCRASPRSSRRSSGSTSIATRPASICTRSRRARTRPGSYLWIDMEQSPYVDVTLDLTEELRRSFPGVGVCLQAYLHRTRDDLRRMLRIGAGVRLVKGAYREPPVGRARGQGGRRCQLSGTRPHDARRSRARRLVARRVRHARHARSSTI